MFISITTTDGAARSLAIPTHPDAPTVGKTDVTGSGANNGSISGVNSAMEYSADGGSTWTQLPE